MSNQPNTVDIRRLRGVLRQIAQLARESSLTGSLEKGARSAGQQFNRILQIVEGQGIDLGGLFEPMPEEASFDQIGVAAAQLASFLEVDEQAATAPPHPQHPSAPPFFAPEDSQHRHGGAPGAPNFVIDMSQFKDLEQLKGLGQMIREQLPEWIKREVEAKMSSVHGHVAHAEAEAAARHAEAETGRVEAEARRAAHQAQTRHGTQQLPENPIPENLGAGSQAQFCDMDMSGARFSDTNLAGAAFSDVNFDNVEFSDVNFSNVTFRDTNFDNAKFHDLNFNNARFHDTNFDNAKFHDASFHNVEIVDGDISGMKINGIPVNDLLRRYEPA